MIYVIYFLASWKGLEILISTYKSIKQAILITKIVKNNRILGAKIQKEIIKNDIRKKPL